MTGLEALAIAGAGVAAGTVNAIVGSGTLITFPALLALGYPPVVANVTNNVGVAPGLVSGAVGYRRELAGQRARAIRFAVPVVLGSLTGSVLILVLPAAAFRTIAPAFVALAIVLVVVQPALARRVAAQSVAPRREGGRWLPAAVYLAGVYGGYFGAALGVLLLGLLGIGLRDTLHRLNALRTVLASLVTVSASIVFAAAADVEWAAAGLIAGGAIVGGQLGARVGRRVPAPLLRGLIVVVGILAIVRLVS